ncbi:phospholipid/glycerol acyltransferase [Chloroherpeton thalassium ATCC 35110]|uniref:Phospholipid/glycerol acyltransferase n=1 Tax=Chloroherpeton thalassium (strain ATCC 35110 / GB-78) TaxID=517418 RepID=B3QY06_CHLT3|nr:lysophospholipid acyltransferase family protein [Chloroherpeton thalassium]ACF13534.1 phospholipid/glycerol acyltransferase [Chloroherpeton thalassium ATCC 35110]
MTIQTLIFILIVFPYTFILSLASILAGLVDGSGKVYHKISQIWSEGCLRLLGIRLKIIGAENYSPDGVYVVVSNHAGMADIPAMLVAMNLNLRLIAKEELGKIPVFGWSLRYGDFILIKRGHTKEALKSLLRAEEKLRDGKSVHLFADGTRAIDGSIQPFKRGAFLLASRTGLPVLPVTILNSHLIAEKNSLKIHSGTITLVIDKPIQLTNDDHRNADKLQQAAFQVIFNTHKKHTQAAANAYPASTSDSES